MPDLVRQSDFYKLLLSLNKAHSSKLQGCALALKTQLTTTALEANNLDFVGLLQKTEATYGNSIVGYMARDMIKNIKLHFSENWSIYQLQAIQAELSLELPNTDRSIIIRVACAIQECITKCYATDQSHLEQSIQQLAVDFYNQTADQTLLSCKQEVLMKIFQYHSVENRNAIIQELASLGLIFHRLYRKHRMIVLKIWAADLSPIQRDWRPVHREVTNPHSLGSTGVRMHRKKPASAPRAATSSGEHKYKFGKTQFDKAVV